MVRKPLKDWLSSIFSLPVVEEFDQTKTEQVIGYDLSGQNIDVRVTDGKVRFEFDFDIVYRCPNGFAGVGFLSLGLSNISKYTQGTGLITADGYEVVTYETKTEMIIKKPVRAFVELEYNQVREQIKQVNINGVEPCQKSY